MTITSDAIQLNGTLRPDYTCDGEGGSPPLTFSEIPDKAQSLALIMEDPDAPSGTFTHWLLYDMSPATLQIPGGGMPQTGKAGVNDFGKPGYGAPSPPNGTHRYVFKLFALDSLLELPEGFTKQQLEAALQGHIIDSAEVVGAYARQSS